MTPAVRLRGGLLVTLLALACAGAAFAFHDDRRRRVDPGPRNAGPVASADDHAATACQDLQHLQRLVADDAEASLVLRYSAAGADDANQAARLESRWLSLASGAMQIDDGLRHDDAKATALGIAITRSQCRLAGVQLR
jgi:hypothetical protein